jgi:glycosyltransferase involved in cell wall biosynthesis
MTQPRVAFVLEQTLGHVTHAANLRALVGAHHEIKPVFAPIEYDVSGWPARVPGYGNWTVRAGLRARRAVREIRRRDGPIEAMFVHTQVPAILAPDLLRRIPTVVSLDATPIQYDELGKYYGHATGGSFIERLKWRANRSCFAAARAVVTWAEWTKRGLVNRYDVPAKKITVIPPGVDCTKWAARTELGRTSDGPVRVLFVGGDLARKGGHVLIEAVRRLRRGGMPVELDLVTRDAFAAEPGIEVHHGLGPNSPGLIGLYQRADVFCLPTLGDCLPMVLSEAGAVGLPLVSTDVGAISEIVRPERTGLLVPPHDPEALAAALGRLAGDARMRREFGDEARRVVRAEYDAAANARRLVELLVAVAREGRAG